MDGGILAMGHLSWLVISQVHLSIRGGKELSPMPNKGGRFGNRPTNGYKRLSNPISYV